MKVRRSSRLVDLRRLPLDGLDMFLLAQVETTLTAAELCDIAPCDKAETMRRLRQLAELLVLELVAETASERATLAQSTFDEESTAPAPQRVLFDEESTTLRPPSSKRRGGPAPAVVIRMPNDEAVTLRPPRPVSVKELMSAAEDLTGKIKVERSSGVVEKSLDVEFRTPAEAVSADGRVVKDRSVFSRQTLVDAEAPDRARAIEEARPARRR